MTITEHEQTTVGVEPADEGGLSVTRLRGARVADVNPARLRAAAVVICALALAVTAVALFMAGARRNAQVAALHDNGTRVTVTVTGCLGTLGGGGYTFVGYACRGAFTLGGHRYDVAIPGSVLRHPGTEVTLVADRADPTLVATVQAAQRSQPSATVFVLPSVFLAALVGLGVVVGLRRRRSSARPPGVVLLTP